MFKAKLDKGTFAGKTEWAVSIYYPNNKKVPIDVFNKNRTQMKKLVDRLNDCFADQFRAKSTF